MSYNLYPICNKKHNIVIVSKLICVPLSLLATFTSLALYMIQQGISRQPTRQEPLSVSNLSYRVSVDPNARKPLSLSLSILLTDRNMYFLLPPLSHDIPVHTTQTKDTESTHRENPQPFHKLLFHMSITVFATSRSLTLPP